MPALIVAYPRKADTQFDESYYAGAHTDLVKQTWGPHGLTGAEIHFPADSAQPYAAMVVLDFSGAEGIDAALGDPATPAVLADIPNFTNAEPLIYRAR
ncbi:EthD family reductase [Croceicoccus mobilis]|uniref:Ethyl tert-butyl ether degradation protein EthD n=1 Tax=Croceicoccus mobilis TaxID=1703339 RepID=A0A916YZR0_9SPHN|nr:EthD family reductase [Croceicoccus mobilis]GGD69034.1 ethyl tert-butyl ether degradation protein EthD [Croceicoccus mobilis]